MAKATLLQLAHTAKGDELILGWMASRKLDGMRCFWDGGISRGLPKAAVPWANTTTDDRYVKEPYASGLWTRYGHVILAPDWFLNLLPVGTMLDGEIGCGRGTFQDTTSIVKSLTQDERWDRVCYRVFDSLTPGTVLQERLIEDDPRNYHVFIRNADKWAIDRGATVYNNLTFEVEYKVLSDMYPTVDGWGDTSLPIALVQQHKLSYDYDKAWATLRRMMEEEVALGGEGMMVRHPTARYETERSHYILKCKPEQDMEGTVIGYVTGKNGKDGKLLGMMGSLVIQLDDGKTVKCSGFTNPERSLTPDQRSTAYIMPGIQFDGGTPVFPKGTRVTFTYRELSRDGIPKEPRYKRKDVR